MGVTDIGRKSECCIGVATFGIGLILASFHCRGTVDVERDMLKQTREHAIRVEWDITQHRHNDVEIGSTGKINNFLSNFNNA